MKKMFNNLKANLAAVLSAAVVEFFGTMSEKVDNHDTEIAALREEVAELKAMLSAGSFTMSAPEAEKAEPVVEPEVEVEAEPEFYDYATNGWVDDGDDPVYTVSLDDQLDWKHGKAMFNAMVHQDKHPAFLDTLLGLSFNGAHSEVDDRKFNGKHVGYSQIGVNVNGHHIPGYWDIRNERGDSEEAKAAANAVNLIWQKVANDFHYGQFLTFRGMMEYVFDMATKHNLDFGPFVSNTPEFNDFAVGLDIDNALAAAAEQADLLSESNCLWNDPEPEAKPEETEEKVSLSLDDLLAGAQFEGEGPAAEVVNEDGIPTTDNNDASTANHDFDDWDEEPETKPESKPETKPESEEKTSVTLDELLADAKIEVDAEGHCGNGGDVPQQPTHDENGKLVAPMPMTYGPLVDTIKKVKTDWSKTCNISEGRKFRACAGNWRGAKFWMEIAGETVECRSIQHALYVQEMAYWGFTTEAVVACDMARLPRDDNGYSVLTNGKYWKDKMDEFVKAHPETSRNRGYRLDHFEYKAWCSLYKDSRNQTQIQDLLSTGDAHLVATKKGDGYQVTNLTRTLEFCRQALRKAGY